MAIRNILRYGDETLFKKSRKVEKFDERLSELLDDLKETLAHANGAGLAAPQVGVLRRVAIVVKGGEDGGEEIIELINPEIATREGEIEALEGCLSVPEKYGLVVRPKKVTVKALDRNGTPFEVAGEDFLARALCHEIDHLDGELFVRLAKELVDASEIVASEDEEKEI